MLLDLTLLTLIQMVLKAGDEVSGPDDDGCGVVQRGRNDIENRPVPGAGGSAGLFGDECHGRSLVQRPQFACRKVRVRRIHEGPTVGQATVQVGDRPSASHFRSMA